MRCIVYRDYAVVLESVGLYAYVIYICSVKAREGRTLHFGFIFYRQYECLFFGVNTSGCGLDRARTYVIYG